MYDASTTISDFLSAASAKQPTPGGGSVAALAGALGAAMGEMVVNYSVTKKDLAAHHAELREALAEFTRAREMLLELMIEDQLAYAAFSALQKLPPDSPDRKSKHPATILACIRCPQAMSATGLAILELTNRLVDKVNPYLLADLAVCAELAMATVRCGYYNVRVNVKELSDASERKRFESETALLVERATDAVRQAIPRILARQG